MEFAYQPGHGQMGTSNLNSGLNTCVEHGVQDEEQLSHEFRFIKCLDAAE